MAVLRDGTELTVTEAARRGVARLVADAEHGADLVVPLRHRPVAAVVSIRRLDELEEAAADLRDLASVLVRTATDSGRRTSLDDVLSAFGHTRESLAAIPDDDEQRCPAPVTPRHAFTPGMSRPGRDVVALPGEGGG